MAVVLIAANIADAASAAAAVAADAPTAVATAVVLAAEEQPVSVVP